MVYDKKSTVILTFIGKNCFYLFDFKVSFLSLFFCSLNMRCLGIDFLGMILFGVIWASWTSGLLSAANFGKLSVIISSSISSAPFSHTSPSAISITGLLTFGNCLGYSVFFKIFFLFAFWVESFYWCVLKLSCYFFCHVQFSQWGHQRHSSFLLQCFDVYIAFWFFPRVPLSLLMSPNYFNMLFTLFFRVLNLVLSYFELPGWKF